MDRKGGESMPITPFEDEKIRKKERETLYTMRIYKPEAVVDRTYRTTRVLEQQRQRYRDQGFKTRRIKTQNI